MFLKLKKKFTFNVLMFIRIVVCLFIPSQGQSAPWNVFIWISLFLGIGKWKTILFKFLKALQKNRIFS